MAHAFNPSTPEQRWADHCEFQATLVYLVYSLLEQPGLHKEILFRKNKNKQNQKKIQKGLEKIPSGLRPWWLFRLICAVGFLLSVSWVCLVVLFCFDLKFTLIYLFLIQGLTM